jgi:hypothetical protein
MLLITFQHLPWLFWYTTMMPLKKTLGHSCHQGTRGSDDRNELCHENGAAPSVWVYHIQTILFIAQKNHNLGYILSVSMMSHKTPTWFFCDKPGPCSHQPSGIWCSFNFLYVTLCILSGIYVECECIMVGFKMRRYHLVVYIECKDNRCRLLNSHFWSWIFSPCSDFCPQY